jgi:hypothetical protein
MGRRKDEHTMTACPLLDDLFNWAAQQPAENITSVACSLATNQSSFQGRDENLVAYAEGPLLYKPGGWMDSGRFRIYVPAAFTGTLTQYFSNRRYGPPDSFTNYPFDANSTDPLDITISSPPLIPLGTGSYSVSINSPAWASTQSLTPQCEAGVLYGIMSNSVLLVISLCGQNTQQPD